MTQRGTAELTNTRFEMPDSIRDSGEEDARRAMWEGFKQLVYYTEEPPAGFKVEWAKE